MFHLPISLLADLTFLSAQQVHDLKNGPATSREFGEYYGRPITESESLQQPIEEYPMTELGVDITAICPRQLSNKQEYVLEQAIRSDQWDEDWSYSDEDEELDEDIWSNIPTKKNQFQQLPVHREVECCPLCYTRVDTPGIPRIDHWRQAHPGQDLTISQASWVLNRSTTREQFCTDIPPDYRVPIEGSEGKGTRYWRLETWRPAPGNMLWERIGSKNQSRGGALALLLAPLQQVGFARIITDYATFAYLGDVFILDPFRGRGLSKWLMEVIVGHPELQGLRRWMLLTRDAHGLYRQVGFSEPSHPERSMELHFPDVYKAMTS